MPSPFLPNSRSSSNPASPNGMPYYNTPISLTRLKKQNGNLTDPAKIILQSQQRQQMPGIQTSFGNLHLNRTADMASLSTGAAELAPNTPAFVPPPVPVNSPEMPAHLSTTRYTSAYQDILNAEQTPTSVSASMSPSSFGSSIGVAGPRVAFAATSVSGSSSTTSPIHRIKEIYRSHDPSFLASPALSTHTTPTIDGYGDISGHAHIHTHGHSSRASPHRVQSPSARLSQSFDQLLAEEAAGAVTHVPYANGAVGSGQQNHSLLEIELQDVKTRQERLLRTLRTKSDEYNNLVNEKNYREKMLLSEIRRHKMDHQLNARQSGEALRQGALRVSELENQLKDALEQHALARQQIARLKDDQERNVLKNDQMHSELVQQVQRHQQEMEEEGKREKEILAAAEKHDVHVQAVLATKDKRISELIEDVNKIQKKCDDLAENKFAQEIKLCEDIQTHIQANEQLRRKHKENTDKLLQQLKRKEKENESLLKKVQKLDKKLKDADELAGKYRKKSEENERQYNQNLAQIQNDHASQLQRTKQEAEEREQKIMQAASERESSLVTEYDTREKGLMVEYRQAASLRSHEFEERERDTEKALAKKTQDYVQLMDQKNAVEDELMMEIKRNQLKIDGLERDLRFKASEFKSIASSLESKEKTIRELKEQLEYAVDTNLKLKDVVTEGEREMGDLEKKARLKEMSLKQQVEEVSTQGKNNVANLKQENELFAQRVQSFESEVDGLQQQLFETRNSLHEAQKEKAMQGTRIKQIEHDNETLRIQFKELEVQQERDRESFEERLKKETDALKTRETNATSQLRDVKKEESRRIVNFHNMERTIEQNKFALKNYLKKEEQLRQQLEQKDAEIERLKTTQTRKEADMNSMVDCRIQRETELARDLDQALEDYQRTTEQLRRREEELKHIEARAYLADQAEEWKIEVEELRERNAVRSSNAEIAKRFLRQQEPWIGVEVVETLFEGYRRKVVVKSVAPNSPALHLGICPGDIVESMNDRHIRKTEELGRVLSKCSVGDTCTLQLLQQGKHKRTIAGLHISSQNICYEDILLLRRIAKLENDDDRTFMNKFKRKLDID